MKEGKRYNKRNKACNKEFYSLRELVPEITGINEDDNAFDAKYKEIQRIVTMFRKSLGQSGSRIRIPSIQKNSIVEALKNFYSKEEARNIIKKLGRNEEPTIEELDLMINIFADASSKFLTDEENELFQKCLLESKGDEYFEKGERIKKAVLDDILLGDELKIYETKIQLIDEYKSILDEALKEWRKKVNSTIKFEKASEIVIKKHPEYMRNMPIVLPPDMLYDIAIEMMKMEDQNNK